MKKLVLLLLLLLAIPLAYAKTGSTTLLAVSETDGGFIGSTADLYIEIKEGTGRVFIDSYPLTKFDTQFSTRFAKSVACDFLNKDCSRYDFFYTIRADAPIIGGPSAGAAMAVLTVAVLDDLKLREDIAMTGTINSGGIIGAVGGIKEKTEAAANASIKKVLIPEGERFVGEEGNKTDIIEYGKKIGIDVVEILSLNDAVYEFTGKKYSDGVEAINITADYEGTMRNISIDLCSRADSLKASLNVSGQNDVLEAAINSSERGKNAFSQKKYYSSASFCFSANIKYNYLSIKDINESKLREKLNSTSAELKKREEKLKNDYKTINDLETYIIVKERIDEVNDYLNLSLASLGGQELDDSAYYLAYSIERLYTVNSWSFFFGKSGIKLDIDAQMLRDSCTQKIVEAQERFDYVALFVPVANLGQISNELENAKQDQKNENNELCLFKASKAKAQVDVVMMSIGISGQNLSNIINKKLELVNRQILKETNKGIFPILGYSYYEYAKELKEEDPYSSLLFSEYALELSNLDIYFKKEEIPYIFRKKIDIDYNLVIIFVSGILVGFVLRSLVVKVKNKSKKSVKLNLRSKPLSKLASRKKR
ncbi:MAG: S16 family serine protease [Candidatus Woesearchaeota archaeon]|nr:S16 family serine protease [Candidatus Woesearchaeota archaeon]